MLTNENDSRTLLLLLQLHVIFAFVVCCERKRLYFRYLDDEWQKDNVNNTDNLENLKSSQQCLSSFCINILVVGKILSFRDSKVLFEEREIFLFVFSQSGIKSTSRNNNSFFFLGL